MKKIAFLLGALLAAHVAFAQNILSSVSMQGSVTASTQSGYDVYTTGGGPRTGRYHYWRPVTAQSTNMSVPLAFNAATGLVSTTGTYYAPGYTMSGSASVTFSNTPTSALWSFTTQQSTTALPVLGAHQWINASVTSTPRVYVSVPNDTDVTITFTGGATPAYNIYVLSGELSGSESGKPNTYTLAAGGTYCFWATLTSAATNLGPTSQDCGISLSFSAAGG